LSITNLAGTPALRKRVTGKCAWVLRSVEDIVGDRSPLPVGHEQRQQLLRRGQEFARQTQHNQDRDMASGPSAAARNLEYRLVASIIVLVEDR